MIKSPAAFPFPGSYALHVVAGEPALVRIIEWIGPQGQVPFGDKATAMVAYPLRIGASGNTKVEIGALIDATPLNADERIEAGELERRLAGNKRPRKVDLAREQQLRMRAIHADVLHRLIAEGVRRRLIDPDTASQALAA